MSDRLDDPSHETIAPESFEPSRGHTDGGRWAYRAALGGAFLVLFAITFVAWFLFTGRSVQIVVTPVPGTLDLEGGLLRVNLGDRWLLRPGEYRLRAARDGYHPLAETLQVADGAEQRFEFELRKLPGELEIAVVPEAVSAEVAIDGEAVGATPLDVLVLEPGTYRVEARASRYQPAQADVEITGMGEREALTLALEPDWAEVTVATDPPGATLFVDGSAAGETPLTAELLSGRHALELRLEGYKPWSRDLQVVAMEPQALTDIVLEQADYLVRFVSVPGGASVSVDGEYRGQAPLTLALRPDASYSVNLALPGYQPQTRELAPRESGSEEVAVRLRPILGTVVVEGTPADAEVFVDGALRGLVNEPIELPSHPHRIEVRREGYESYRTTVTPNPQLEQLLQVALVSEAERALARTPEVLDTAVGVQLKLFRPAGFFRLGSPRREQGRRSNEFQRQVELSRPFYLGFREVTNAQFRQYRAEHDSGVVGRQTLALDKQPVVRVAWDDAARFCNWLSRREGLPEAYREEDGRMVPVSPMNTGFRLPTEAEWVLAARYGGSSEGRAAARYSWGDSLPPAPGSVNIAGREAAGLVDTVLSTHEDPYPATAVVGQFSPERSGLYDLGGNVREWMHDYYAIRLTASGPENRDPLGPADGQSHLVRGPGWRSGSITELRLAWRGEGLEGRDDLGFRLARYAE